MDGNVFNESKKACIGEKRLGEIKEKPYFKHTEPERLANLPCRNGAGPGSPTERERKAIEELPPLETYLVQPRFIYSMKLTLTKT